MSVDLTGRKLSRGNAPRRLLPLERHALAFIEAHDATPLAAIPGPPSMVARAVRYLAQRDLVKNTGKSGVHGRWTITRLGKSVLIAGAVR